LQKKSHVEFDGTSKEIKPFWATWEQ